MFCRQEQICIVRYYVLLLRNGSVDTEKYTKRVEAFETWMYRRKLRISWTEVVTNLDILRMMQKKKKSTLSIKKRKMQYLGHYVMKEDKH